MKKLQFEDVKYILSKVGEISIFHYLSVDEKWELLSLCEIFEYSSGEKIVSQGETGTCFYAILSGMVNVTVHEHHSNKEIFLAAISVGDFFGEAGIFSNTERTATVKAAETTEILCISRNNFFNYINTYAHAGVKILMLFVNGLLKKLNESNHELAFVRREVLDQGAIDQFLQTLANREQESELNAENNDRLHSKFTTLDKETDDNLFYNVCLNCKGSGIVENTNCPQCMGKGIIPTNLALQLLDFLNAWNLAHFKK